MSSECGVGTGDAVELRLRSGEVRRIGTDDPLALAAALKPAVHGG
jgi:hypothetical protein